MTNLPVERREPQSGPVLKTRGCWALLGSPSLPNDRRDLHVLLDAVARLLPGVVNALPFLQGDNCFEPSVEWRCGRDGLRRGTDFSFLDAGVDSVQQVGSVPVALGEFSQLLPDQLPLAVAHHLLECWVHVLGKKSTRVDSISTRRT